MKENRLEKKFVYKEGDISFNFFILNSMFKKMYPSRKVNSIYFDTPSHKDIWENINGFGDRKKIRVRWYDKINNSEVFIEKKRKINFITQKTVKKIDTFKNFKDLNNYLYSEDFHNNFLRNKFKDNLERSIYVQYVRSYYELPNKKLRLTIDKDIKIMNSKTSNFFQQDEIILELKYDVKYSNYVNDLIFKYGLNNRNRKFSKYVNSFIQLNNSAFI